MTEVEAAKTISLRLPHGILSELDTVAKTTERDRTYIIKKAIQRYLEEYADYQIALDRLKDKDDKIISSKEMRKLLASQN
jgi:predicted DNA-binding protein